MSFLNQSKTQARAWQARQAEQAQNLEASVEMTAACQGAALDLAELAPPRNVIQPGRFL